MNFFKTSLLLAAMTAIFMGAGYLIGGQGGMLIALVVAADIHPIGNLRVLSRLIDMGVDEATRAAWSTVSRAEPVTIGAQRSE